MDAAPHAIVGGILRVPVSDLEHSISFYTRRLGFEVLYQSGRHWATLKGPGGVKVGLLAVPKPGPAVAPCIQIGFDVDAPLEEALARMELATSRDIEVDPTGAVRMAYFFDPDGHEHYLCEHRSGR